MILPMNKLTLKIKTQKFKFSKNAKNITEKVNKKLFNKNKQDKIIYSIKEF